jgi:hypothetical protein
MRSRISANRWRRGWRRRETSAGLQGSRRARCKLSPAQSLANLTEQGIDQLVALVKTRLKRMQYPPGLIDGFLANTGLDLTLS